MTRRGWWVVAAALVVAVVVVGVVWAVNRPSDPVALPQVCEVPRSETVAALVPDVGAPFSGGDAAACNLQSAGDAASYAALFLFVSQNVYGIDADDRSQACDGIGRTPSADGPGEQSCIASDPTAPGGTVEGYAFRGEVRVQVSYVTQSVDGLPAGAEDSVADLLEQLLAAVPVS